MTLLNIADMLADVLGFEDVYAGNIDANKERCLGVYNAKINGAKRICLGGKSCTKTLKKRFSILIHWTDNPTTAEQKALEVSDLLADIKGYEGNGFTVKFIIANEPVPVGRDERGVCEYVIEGTIYYERKDE